MVMQIEPIDRVISYLKSQRDYDEVIFTTPMGNNLSSPPPMSFPERKYIILCGIIRS
jgi:tRNA (guanine37-N1)-methyltransferase